MSKLSPQFAKGRATVAALPALFIAACSSGGDRTPTAPVAPPPPPPPLAQPTPPDGAAPNLTIPQRLADGSYATLNRGLTPEAAAWHLRAALNVASLNCSDPTLAPAYNRLLTTHKAELSKAHQAVSTAHGKSLDSVMTRLYNYWAQPPVLKQFCVEATQIMQVAGTWPKGSFISAASQAINQLDQPFHAFYSRYDTYRQDLNAWRATNIVVAQQSAPS